MKKMITITFVLAAAFVLFTGCSKSKPTEGANVSTGQTSLMGSIVLKVNPEIEISYNENGLVSKIEGMNDDGKSVISKCTDYIGKETKSIVNELVTLIKNEGYFVSDDDAKNITISLSKGSEVPSQNFLSDIAIHIQSTVDNMNFEKTTPLILAKDDDDNEIVLPKSAQAENGISRQKALEIALAHVNIAKPDAREIEIELDNDDNIKHYEVEFKSKDIEYDFEIAVLDGAIIKYDNVIDDDNDSVTIIEIDNNDDDDDQKTSTDSATISRDQALSIALTHIGTSSSDITDLSIELDNDDNVTHYDIKFKVGTTEYKFDIDSVSGQITNFENDVNDDVNDDVDDDVDDDVNDDVNDDAHDDDIHDASDDTNDDVNDDANDDDIHDASDDTNDDSSDDNDDDSDDDSDDDNDLDD